MMRGHGTVPHCSIGKCRVLQQAASVDLPITDVVLPDAMTAREPDGEARALFPDLAVP